MIVRTSLPWSLKNRSQNCKPNSLSVSLLLITSEPVSDIYYTRDFILIILLLFLIICVAVARAVLVATAHREVLLTIGAKGLSTAVEALCLGLDDWLIKVRRMFLTRPLCIKLNLTTINLVFLTLSIVVVKDIPLNPPRPAVTHLSTSIVFNAHQLHVIRNFNDRTCGVVNTEGRHSN